MKLSGGQSTRQKGGGTGCRDNGTGRNIVSTSKGLRTRLLYKGSLHVELDGCIYSKSFTTEEVVQVPCSVAGGL